MPTQKRGNHQPAREQASFANGANQTYNITPQANYQIADVKVDGTSIGAVANYTFTNITASHTIEATFSLLPGIALNKPTTAQSSLGAYTPEYANDADGTNSKLLGGKPIHEVVAGRSGRLLRYQLGGYQKLLHRGRKVLSVRELYGSMDNLNFTKDCGKNIHSSRY